jgi:hypothetical protein
MIKLKLNKNAIVSLPGLSDNKKGMSTIGMVWLMMTRKNRGQCYNIRTCLQKNGK